MNENKTDYTTYLENAASLMGLTLTPEYLAGVVANFTRLTEVAALVNEFDLSEDIEVAPIFEP
jgi:hypothetical protein